MKLLEFPLCRLAVMPPYGADKNEQEFHFSRGFVEDLVTDLSRFPNLGLISPHSSFASRFQGMSDPEVSAHLQSDYLLKTSIRRRSETIRINAQLVDSKSGGILWAERYDAPEKELFSLQDTLVEKVVAELSKRIDAITLEAARRKPVTELKAYDCWLRGMEKLHGASIETDEEARELFEQALEIDPHCARAYVGLSLSHFNEWSCQNWNLAEVSECRAFQYASRALQLDHSDHVAHLVAGRIHLYRRDFARADEHLDKAYELNPNDADQLAQIASCKAFLGDLDSADKLFTRAMELNPFCDPWYYAYGGFIQIMRKNFDEGIAMALKAPLTTVWIDLAAFIAIAHAYRGNHAEAKVYGEIYIKAFEEKINNGKTQHVGEAFAWQMRVNPFRREEDTEFYLEGLRIAGFQPSDDQPEIEPPLEPTPLDTSPVFRSDEGHRHMVFEGAQARLNEVKGFKDIERLLEAGGDEVHCTELMGMVSETSESNDVLDAQARSEIAARIRELQAELAELEEFNDFARAEKVRAELDPLIDHLAKSVGIGGRSRKLAAPAERARSAVTLRIRSAIGKIGAVHPALARHFENSIRTGTFCSYAPEKALEWIV